MYAVKHRDIRQMLQGSGDCRTRIDVYTHPYSYKYVCAQYAMTATLSSEKRRLEK